MVDTNVCAEETSLDVYASEVCLSDLLHKRLLMCLCKGSVENIKHLINKLIAQETN